MSVVFTLVIKNAVCIISDCFIAVLYTKQVSTFILVMLTKDMYYAADVQYYKFMDCTIVDDLDGRRYEK